LESEQVGCRRRQRDAAADSGFYVGRGRSFVLGDEGKNDLRFLTWAEVSTALTDNDPGTVDACGERNDESLDIGLRRARA